MMLFFVFILLLVNSSWAEVSKDESAVCVDLLGLDKKDILQSKAFDGMNFYETKKLYTACYKSAGEKNLIKLVAFSRDDYTLVLSSFDTAKSEAVDIDTIDYSEYVKLAKSKSLNREEKLKKESYRMSSALVLNVFEKNLYKEKIDPKLFTEGKVAQSKTSNIETLCMQFLGFKDSAIQDVVASNPSEDARYYSLKDSYIGCKMGKNKTMNAVTINKQTNDILLSQYDITKNNLIKERMFNYDDYLESLTKSNLTKEEQKEQTIFVLLSQSVLLKLDKDLYKKAFAMDTLKTQAKQGKTSSVKKGSEVSPNRKSKYIGVSSGSSGAVPGVGGAVAVSSAAVSTNSKGDKKAKQEPKPSMEEICFDILGVRSEDLKSYINGGGKKEFNVYYGTDSSYVACRGSKKDSKLVQVAVINKKNNDLAIMSYDKAEQKSRGIKVYKYQKYVDNLGKKGMKPEEKEEQKVFGAITKSVLTELAPDVYKRDFDPKTLAQSSKAGKAKEKTTETAKTQNVKAAKTQAKTTKPVKAQSAKAKKSSAKKATKPAKTKNSKVQKTSPKKPSKAKESKDKNKYNSESEHRVKDFVPDYLLQDLPSKLRNK